MVGKLYCPLSPLDGDIRDLAPPSRGCGSDLAIAEFCRFGKLQEANTSLGLARVPGRTRVRQRPPTAKGFVFITMEDENGLMNVIVKPDVYGRYYKVLRNCFLLIVEGTIQKQGGILNILAEGAVGM